MSGLIPLILIVLIACWLYKVSQANKAALGYIKSNAHIFARKRSQLVFVDDYGMEYIAQWEREKQYIVSTVIPSILLAAGQSRLLVRNLHESRLLRAIENAAIAASNRIALSEFSNVTTGIEYERYCADLLREAGWNVSLTKASGDQGADLVTERDGRRLVVQCKLYSNPVGNKAVQEAVAARVHEQADQAVVVSNAPYTKAARQLAGTTKTILLHHDDLRNL